MAETWGATTLYLSSYSRPGAEMYFSEKALLPDPTIVPTIPQSVIQGFGRKRKRVRVSGYGTKAVVDALEADMYAMTSRVATFDDGFTMTAYIEPGTFERHTQLGLIIVFYDLTFIEG